MNPRVCVTTSHQELNSKDQECHEGFVQAKQSAPIQVFAAVKGVTDQIDVIGASLDGKIDTFL